MFSLIYGTDKHSHLEADTCTMSDMNNKHAHMIGFIEWQ